MKDVEELTSFLSILADETRLGVLYLLKDNKMVSKEIQDALKKAQSTISQHLKILYNAEIIDYDQEGSIKNYYVKDPKIFKILKSLEYYLLEKEKAKLRKTEEQDILDTLH